MKGGIVVFIEKPPEKGPKSDGGNLQRIVAFSQVKGIHQTIELFRQIDRGTLSPVQPWLPGESAAVRRSPG